MNMGKYAAYNLMRSTLLRLTAVRTAALALEPVTFCIRAAIFGILSPCNMPCNTISRHEKSRRNAAPAFLLKFFSLPQILFVELFIDVV